MTATNRESQMSGEKKMRENDQQSKCKPNTKSKQN